MGIFSGKKPEPAPQDSSETMQKIMPESWKDFTQNDVKYAKSCSPNLCRSLGADDLDLLLSYYAPVHEKRFELMFDGICKILENQKQILEELASLRQAYQNPENTSAPSYFKTNTR